MAKADILRRQVRARIRSEEAKAARVALESGHVQPGSAPRVVEPKAKYERRQSGLVMLANRGKISAREQAAGERYGSLFRDAHMEGEACIKSALGSIDESRGSGGGGKLATLMAPEFLAQVRQDLYSAQIDALRSQATLIAVCDVICGKQWTPQQVAPTDRGAQLQIETSLRIALDLLVDYFAQNSEGRHARAA